MGIYSNGRILGIRIYNFDSSNNISILFEQKYNELINYQQMREAYLFYTNLTDKNDVFFKIYTECFSTLEPYNKDKFMDWYPISLITFLEKFGN